MSAAGDTLDKLIDCQRERDEALDALREMVTTFGRDTEAQAWDKARDLLERIGKEAQEAT